MYATSCPKESILRVCVRYQSITLEQPLENQQWRKLKKKKREHKFDEASQDTREVDWPLVIMYSMSCPMCDLLSIFSSDLSSLTLSRNKIGSMPFEAIEQRI